MKETNNIMSPNLFLRPISFERKSQETSIFGPDPRWPDPAIDRLDIAWCALDELLQLIHHLAIDQGAPGTEICHQPKHQD